MDSNGSDDVEADWVMFSDTATILDLSDTSNTVGSGVYNGAYSKAINVDDNLLFDYVRQVENISGSSENDIFRGTTVGNSILSGAGDDTIYITTGTDYIDGGTNNDWVDMTYMPNAYFYYDLNGRTLTTTNTNSTLYNIENVMGNDGNSTGWGTTGVNTFVAKGGNDHVLGREGNDVYDLGSGDDRASANYGSDTIVGGAGNDTLDYRYYYGQSAGNIIILQNFAGYTMTIESKVVSGLQTLVDGEYDFFKVKDGRGEWDYLYREDDLSSDFETFYLSSLNDTFVGNETADYIGNITDNSGNDIIYGMGGNDYFYGLTGNKYVNGGTGNDIFYTTYADITNYDTIVGGADTDTISMTTTDTNSSTAFNNVSEVEALTFYTGGDTVTFTDKASFDTFNGKFSGNINLNNGTDIFTFSSSITADLDFTGIINLETWTLSTNNDTLTYGTDEKDAGIRTINMNNGTNNITLNADMITTSKATINGGTGVDDFTLDFSRLDEADYIIDGGSGATDEVNVTGSYTLTADKVFGNVNSFDNIDKLDLSGLTIGGADTLEFTFTGANINAWTNAGSNGGTLTLNIDAGDEQNIGYTNSGGTYVDGVTIGQSYALQSGATLIIE
jgi:Ca2+-binding RTX toxin-like protein